MEVKLEMNESKNSMLDSQILKEIGLKLEAQNIGRRFLLKWFNWFKSFPNHLALIKNTRYFLICIKFDREFKVQL